MEIGAVVGSPAAPIVSGWKVKRMRMFKNMQEPFMDPEFCNILSKYVPLKRVGGIPTFNGKRTFFWSSVKFARIGQQFLVGENITKPVTYFFTKYSMPYEETIKSYHQSFRNQVRKAIKNNLIAAVYNTPGLELIKTCYRIYDENIKRLNSLSFPYEFFYDLCKLSYAQLYVVKNDQAIVSFGLLLGNFLYLQASTKKGRDLCANNLLYDTIYRNFENRILFLGTSISNSGHFRFKINSGAKPLPAAPTKLDLIRYLGRFKILRNNKFFGFIARKIDSKEILKYILN